MNNDKYMVEIAQGATPTIELALPTSANLSEYNIYFSIVQFKRLVLEKSNANSEDITFSGNIVSVYLSQMETLKMEEGEAKVQINLVGDSGKIRIPTYEAPIMVLNNQIRRPLN